MHVLVSVSISVFCAFLCLFFFLLSICFVLCCLFVCFMFIVYYYFLDRCSLKRHKGVDPDGKGGGGES